jgi:hypothetical protein
VDALADLVHLGLQIVQVLMQAAPEDLFHLGVGQFGTKLAQEAFGRVPEGLQGRPGDGME